MNPEQELIRAKDAQALLNNKLFREAFEKVSDHLERRELQCNTAKEPEVAADIIRCKQLLKGIEREIKSVIKNGEVAEIRLAEINKPRLSMFRR